MTIDRDGGYRCKMETLRFKNDTPMRRKLWTADAFAHPAKGHCAMWQEMILRYSKEGDTVLDPLAGVGATLLAALMGRNVIVNELEHHFLLPMVRSWAKMRQNPMLGFPISDVQFLWGDARNLAQCRPWPYQELAIRYSKAPDLTTLKAIRRKYRLPLVTSYLPLPDASVGAAITSPPYEQAQSGGGIAITGHYNDPKLAQRVYSDRAMAARPVDAIVTSPPYQMENPGLESGSHPVERDYNHNIRYSERQSENIGNMKGDTYWEAMRQVYAECWRVLKPGGLLALVLKGFTCDGQYVDLPGQTEALLLETGWQKHDQWRRELWSLSFWRTLQATDKEEKVIAHRRGLFDLDIQEVKRMKRVLNGKLDERLRFEEVLAFRKVLRRKDKGAA